MHMAQCEHYQLGLRYQAHTQCLCYTLPIPPACRFPAGVQLLNVEELPGAGAMGVAVNGMPIFPAADNHNALFCRWHLPALICCISGLMLAPESGVC
jgi:hypothetical protein